MIYYSVPFNKDKNIGVYYNKFMEILPNDDDWAVFFDSDTIFSTSDFGILIEQAIEENSDASAFTCYTNRVACRWQIAPGIDKKINKMEYHRQFGAKLKKQNGSSCEDVTNRKPLMSGVFFALKKSAWKKCGMFKKTGMLGVDNDYHHRLCKGKQKMYLIKGLYLYHWYRNNGKEGILHLLKNKQTDKLISANTIGRKMKNKIELDWSKVGIAISTFSGDKTCDKRTEITEKCLLSVLDSVSVDCVKVIVNDASTNKKHLQTLDKYRKDFHVVDFSENKGNPSGKNVAIKYMFEQGCDYMFLIDDDIKLLPGFAELYIDAIKKTKIHHFCFRPSYHSGGKIKKINGVKVRITSTVAGVLLTLTRASVEKVGYFSILPYKYGHSHTLYTLRNIKAGMSQRFADVVGSNKYLKDISAPEGETIRADNYKSPQSSAVKNNWKVGVKSGYVPYSIKND